MNKVTEEDNNYIYYWIGKNIKKYRKQKGWTQKQFAEKCNYSVNYISDLEGNTFKTCSLNTLYHISKILEIHIRNLFDDIEDKKK